MNWTLKVFDNCSKRRISFREERTARTKQETLKEHDTQNSKESSLSRDKREEAGRAPVVKGSQSQSQRYLGRNGELLKVLGQNVN